MKTFPFTIYDSRIAIYSVLLHRELHDLQLRPARTATECEDVQNDGVAFLQFADSIAERLRICDRHSVDALNNVALAESGIVAVGRFDVGDEAFGVDLLDDQSLLA